VRIEIGPREVKEEKVTLVRRDTLKKTSCPREEIIKETKSLLLDIQESVTKKASDWFNAHIATSENIKDVKSKIREGIVEVAWCGNDECGFEIERLIEARVLGVNPNEAASKDHVCLICGKKAKSKVRLARAY
jgi:prolyl-tRNA synthetase